MAKRKPAKKKQKKNITKKPPATLPGVMPDMDQLFAGLNQIMAGQEFENAEEIEAFMEGLMGKELPSFEPETPLEKAQDLVYQAFEATRKKDRIKLAKEALEISADCADAYMILAAEAAKSPVARRDYLEKAVSAGQRAIGDEYDELVGGFWGFHQTRPYMRAREVLMLTLWEIGERDEAVEMAEESLRLNPTDNQGIRHVLIGWLLQRNDNEAASLLFKQYEDDVMAAWTYSSALLLYRVGGDSAESRDALATALEYNEHVPKFLLGKKRIPKRLPEYMSFGDESEAIDYVVGDRELWLGTPGAVAWLQGVVAGAS